MVVQNQPQIVKYVENTPCIQHRAEPSGANPKAEVMFKPRSAIDMYKIIGMKFPFCMFRKNKIVPITAKEKQHDTNAITITAISRSLISVLSINPN